MGEPTKYQAEDPVKDPIDDSEEEQQPSSNPTRGVSDYDLNRIGIRPFNLINNNSVYTLVNTSGVPYSLVMPEYNNKIYHLRRGSGEYVLCRKDAQGAVSTYLLMTHNWQDQLYVLNIVPTPSTATVTINGVQTRSVSVLKNTVVNYTVSASGYAPTSSSITVTGNINKTVVLTQAPYGLIRQVNKYGTVNQANNNSIRGLCIITDKNYVFPIRLDSTTSYEQLPFEQFTADVAIQNTTVVYSKTLGYWKAARCVEKSDYAQWESWDSSQNSFVARRRTGNFELEFFFHTRAALRAEDVTITNDTETATVYWNGTRVCTFNVITGQSS